VIRDIIRKASSRLGYDIRRITPLTHPTLQLAQALEAFDIDMVLDVGANEGQFGSQLRSAGYRAAIVSFEPLREAHQSLVRNAARDPRWIVHSRVAMGDYEGEVDINVAGNSVSSSLLPMAGVHSGAAQGSAYVRAEKVSLARLDAAAAAYVKASAHPFLKIDTQGTEWEVLDGATAIMPRVRGVMCELSLVELYEGQRLWLDLVERLEREGFALWALFPGFSDPRDGRMLQVDGVFFRADGAISNSHRD
jgi:FkbM family methyltransferase